MANIKEDPYRAAITTSVAAIIKDIGFGDAERMALESLVEMTQSLISQLAKSSKHYSELANRSQVMVTDVSLALIDAGLSLEEIKTFTDTHLNKPSGVIPPQQETEVQPARPLVVSQSGQTPQYVHDNLPSFPDKHSYIQTAAQRLPTTDYQLVREKAANQKKSAETALTKFIAKTGDANYYSDEPDNILNQVFPLIACKPTALSYLSSLLPKDENEYEVFDLKREQDLPENPTKNNKRLKPNLPPME